MSGHLHVVGAGGHAKVIVACAVAAGFDVSVYDSDEARVGADVLGRQVRALRDLDFDVDVVIAIGNNAARKRVAADLAPGRRFRALVHPHAWVAPTAHLGAGTVVFAGAVVQPDARIGAHAIVNTSASVDHDCVLGDFVHVAPGSHLAGNVVLDEGAFCGVGVSIIPGKRVGAWTTVGAGAVVVDDLAAGVVALGVPARVKS